MHTLFGLHAPVLVWTEDDRLLAGVLRAWGGGVAEIEDAYFLGEVFGEHLFAVASSLTETGVLPRAASGHGPIRCVLITGVKFVCGFRDAAAFRKLRRAIDDRNAPDAE